MCCTSMYCNDKPVRCDVTKRCYAMQDHSLLHGILLVVAIGHDTHDLHIISYHILEQGIFRVCIRRKDGTNTTVLYVGIGSMVYAILWYYILLT